MDRTLEMIEEVEKINFELYDQNSFLIHQYGMGVEYKTNGYEFLINFMDCCMYDSDNDERDVSDEGEYTETVMVFVRRKINELIHDLQEFKL